MLMLDYEISGQGFILSKTIFLKMNPWFQNM